MAFHIFSGQRVHIDTTIHVYEIESSAGALCELYWCTFRGCVGSDGMSTIYFVKTLHLIKKTSIWDLLLGTNTHSSCHIQFYQNLQKLLWECVSGLGEQHEIGSSNFQLYADLVPGSTIVLYGFIFGQLAALCLVSWKGKGSGLSASLNKL